MLSGLWESGTFFLSVLQSTLTFKHPRTCPPLCCNLTLIYVKIRNCQRQTEELCSKLPVILMANLWFSQSVQFSGKFTPTLSLLLCFVPGVLSVLIMPSEPILKVRDRKLCFSLLIGPISYGPMQFVLNTIFHFPKAINRSTDDFFFPSIFQGTKIKLQDQEASSLSLPSSSSIFYSCMLCSSSSALKNPAVLQDFCKVTAKGSEIPLINSFFLQVNFTRFSSLKWSSH